MNSPSEVRAGAPPGCLRRRRLLTAAVVAAVSAGAAVLYAFPPAEHSFYPGCLFHRLTGLLPNVETNEAGRHRIGPSCQRLFQNASNLRFRARVG